MLLPLEIDTLKARLEDWASKQDGSLNLEPGPRQRYDLTESPPPRTAVQDLELSCRQELIKDGGRPACSIQEFSHILAEPMARYEAVLPWLTDEPESEDGIGEIKTVFSRQFTRWWDFRKSQWDSRGLGDSEAGFSAFLEASRRKYEGTGLSAMVSAPSFDETIRRQWQYMPASRRLLKDQEFSAYADTVKIRLAPHQFTRPLQLKKDPQKQTVWTNWLEYLSFEKSLLEMLTATAESLEQEYRQSRRRLRMAMQPNSNNATSSSAASGSTQTRQPGTGAKAVNLAMKLEAAQADRDASQKTICDFIRETELYTYAQTAAYYQRHRVEWVIKEARFMETEMSQQSKMGKSRKRGRDEILPESRLKRTKQGDGDQNADPSPTPGKPHTRRSTRLTSLNDRAELEPCA